MCYIFKSPYLSVLHTEKFTDEIIQYLGLLQNNQDDKERVDEVEVKQDWPWVEDFNQLMADGYQKISVCMFEIFHNEKF